jgi:acyl-CoA reductase-like NAD-dependent aldehyde dehydrogenase
VIRFGVEGADGRFEVHDPSDGTVIASVPNRDPGEAVHAVALAARTGMIGPGPRHATAPFGGVKQSGLGREGSAEGLEEYQEIRFYNLARRATG